MGESGYNGRSDDCHTPREIQTVYRSTKEFLNKRARCVHQAVKLNLQSTVLAEIDHDPVIFLKIYYKTLVSFYVKSFLNIMMVFSISGLYSNEYSYVNISLSSGQLLNHDPEQVNHISDPCPFFVFNKDA